MSVLDRCGVWCGGATSKLLHDNFSLCERHGVDMHCDMILKIYDILLFVGLTRAEAIHVCSWCSCQTKTETDAQLASELIKLHY